MFLYLVREGILHYTVTGRIKNDRITEDADMKIVVVNAGPRKGWNTDTLLTKAAEGATEAGAEIVRFDLYGLDRFTGCISCFGCKKEKTRGAASAGTV